MKTLILFLFTCITYVFSEVIGPLGFAAKMPPFITLRSEKYKFKDNSLRGAYGIGDLLLLFIGEHTDSCAEHLSAVCKELRSVYGNDYPVGQMQYLCDNQRTSCQMLPQVEKELCNYDYLNYESNSRFSWQLNPEKCHDFYTKCRLRSRACSSTFRDRCWNILSLCYSNYRDYQIRSFFASLGDDYESPDFLKKIESSCRDQYNTSNQFLQRCLDPEAIVIDLSLNKEFPKKIGNFSDYPNLSAGALVNARKLDGGLFTPETDSGIDSSFLLGFLIAQTTFHFDFIRDCKYVTEQCMGLRFFPQSAYFCDSESKLPQGDNCKNTKDILLNNEVPKLKALLSHLLTLVNISAKETSKTGINVEMCLKFLGPCSFLEELDSILGRLCQILRGQCAHDLEVGSALSIFESSMRDYISKEESLDKDTCESGIRTVCPNLLNRTSDFLIFCLKPKHTCHALKELYKLRCDNLKKALANTKPKEEDCARRTYETTIFESCLEGIRYYKYIKLCRRLYYDNKFVKNYQTDEAEN